MKRGRPPLAPEFRSKRELRVVLYTERDDLDGIRALAEYYGLTIQELTRRWWRTAVQRAAADHKIDFRSAAKNN